MEGPGKEPSESIAQNLCMQSPKLGHSLENSQLERRIHHYSITKKTRSLKVQQPKPCHRVTSSTQYATTPTGYQKPNGKKIKQEDK